MRYQRTNERRAVILMVVLSLLTLFALVGITFVLYADAEAAAARVAREASTMQTADVMPQEALAFFLGQLIYDVPDASYGLVSGLRGHSLARTMYGMNYSGTVPPAVIPPVPGFNVNPYDGIGRLHYASNSLMTYPLTPLNNVPNNPLYGGIIDDYAMVNYTWFSGDLTVGGQPFVRDPERFGIRTAAQVTTNTQPNAYVPCNAPYTYPDLNSFFLAAMRADGTVLTPSYHRPWLFQVANGKFYWFNDVINNPNWTNQVGKYLTLRPRPAEHPVFPYPADPTGDVKNLPFAPGGNDSIWIDLNAPVMRAPDGTMYKMMFAPLILDLDGRINLNTAGNILAYIAAMGASANPALTSGPQIWQAASGAHVSNQGWGPWEVNLSKVLYGDQASTPYPSTVPPTPPEWMRLFTGMSYATTTPPNGLPIIVQPGSMSPTPLPPGLSSWMLPGVRGRYLETLVAGAPLFTPNGPPASTIPFPVSAISLNTLYQHSYAQSDLNGLNETVGGATPTLRPILPAGLTAQTAFPSFVGSGYSNGNLATEGTNHPLLFNALQNPLLQNPLLIPLATRAFRASDMESLLRPNASSTGPTNVNASAVSSDLTRLCPANLGPLATQWPALRSRNLVTTQSWDVGSPGVTPYWWNGMTTGYMAPNASNNYLLAPYGAQPSQTVAGVTSNGFPPLPPTAASGNVPGITNPVISEFGNDAVGAAIVPDWSAVSANSSNYYPTSFNPALPTNDPTGVTAPGYVSPGARIRLNRPLPPYPHMGTNLMPPFNLTAPSPYGVTYPLVAGNPIYNQYLAAQNARQALANDIYRRLVSLAGLLPIPPSTPPLNAPVLGTSGNPNAAQLAPRRWLAQLAVNIVDYIDEDDIMTPFNFYTIQDNSGNALVPPASTVGLTQLATAGPDDLTANAQNTSGTNATGANPDFWVFGTELPKVVINEVLATAQTVQATGTGSDTVKVWVELYNTMPVAGTPATGTNTQPQDQSSVPLFITSTAGATTGYSPYRISICQYTMDQANGPVPVAGLTNQFAAQYPPPPNDNSANVLGQAYENKGANGVQFPVNTTDQDFSLTNTGANTGPGSNLTNGVPLSQTLPPTSAPAVYQPSLATHIGLTNNKIAGVDAGSFFLVGPPSASGKYPNDPFVSQGAANNPPGLPNNVPFVQTNSMQYSPTWTNSPTPADERTSGLTVMLRRLANPYLPLQTNPTLANYNPYVTVDYIQNVFLQGAAQANPKPVFSFGKSQPYAASNRNIGPTPITAEGYSPVQLQTANPNPPPPLGAVQTGYNNPPNLWNTFGYLNYPLPTSGHYDWLVHLDRLPISPMELLHVSAYPPYKLTQQFMQWSDNVPTSAPGAPGAGPNGTLVAGANGSINTFGHYAPWFDTYPALNPTTANNASTMNPTWWFDPNLPPLQSHRLYRLFEFLECGDRAFGVNGLGRIPGKVNINTVWDAEILQALVDPSLQGLNIAPGTPPYPPINPAATDQVSQIFSNMMISRSPAYYNAATNPALVNLGTYTNNGLGAYPTPIGPVNMGTGSDDRPFMPLSIGQYQGASATPPQLQFPNGLSVTTDTILRTNNPFFYKGPNGNMNAYPIVPPQTATTPQNQWLLFQNYTDTQSTHPYFQTQLLTKLYNNITTRSNTFAVFLTVGFFQVVTDPATGAIVPALNQPIVPGMPIVPQLGAEIGRDQGKQVRHHMFAIVDRTNLATFLTTGQAILPATAVSGPSAATNPPNLTGYQQVQIPSITPLTPTNTTVTGTATQLLVTNPLTGIPGLIQAGTQLVIEPGAANEETVTVNSVTPPAGPGLPASFTANFTLPHGVGNTPFAIIQRGNPGPWLTIPYDPRLDFAVVQYFSIID